MRSESLKRRVALLAISSAAIFFPACQDVAGPVDNVSTVVDLAVDIPAAGVVRLRWSHVPDASRYLIERRTGLDGAFTALDEVPAPSGSQVEYFDRSVEPLTFYGYRIRSQGRLGGTSGPSEVAGARAAATPGIEVAISMQAPDPSAADVDGFRLRVAGPQAVEATVQPGDTALVTPLSPGMYTLTLSEVAPTCAVEGGNDRDVAVTDQGNQVVSRTTFKVVCRDQSNGSLAVEIETAGDSFDADGVVVRVLGTAGGGVSVTDTLATPAGQRVLWQDARLINVSPGSYEVFLANVDADLCILDGPPNRSVSVSAGASEVVTYSLDCSDNVPPRAEANGPYSATAGEALSLRSSGSVDPDGSLMEFRWDFGDGAQSSEADPQHTYVSPGTYRARLTVTDGRGASDVDSATVRVEAPNQNPVPVIDAPTEAFVDSTVVLSALPGSSDPDGQIVAYEWDFGDGTNATGASQAKVYRTEGTYRITLRATDDDGASASVSHEVSVTLPPNVEPMAEAGGPYTGIQGEAMEFDGSESIDVDGTLVRYDWQFGNGTGATGATAFNTYFQPGTYIAVLTVLDDRGGASTDTATVVVFQNPGTNLAPVATAGGPYAGSTGQPVVLNGSGSYDLDGQIESYTWYHEDGSTSTGRQAVKTYSSPGIFKVTLVVADNLGVIGSDTASVVVTGAGQLNTPPVASANGPYNSRPGLPVAFLSTGSFDPDGFIVAWDWDFGDGASATGPSPTHTYSAPGSYAVSLVVTDNGGASAVAVTLVTVGSGIPPVAAIAGPTQAVVGEALLFDATGSGDPDGTIVNYSWDFGDGQTANGSQAVQVYSAPGNYWLRLTVTDDSGLTDTDSVRVSVASQNANQAPVANANGPYEAVVDQPISFSGAGSTDPDGAIVSYQWTFGDGSSASGQSVTHTYTGVGSYIAVLAVTDDQGATSADTVDVTVTSTPSNVAPIAEANGPYAAEVNQLVFFSSAGSVDPDGVISSYIWLFGDGGSSFGASPSHTYAQAGTYTARLFVTDNLGGTAVDTAVVTIGAGGGGGNQLPQAEANGPYSGAVGASISFSSAGSFDPDGTIQSYAWDFGDGTSGTGAAPTHTYASAGTFTVSLTVTDDSGATAVDNAQVTVTGGGGGNQAPTAEANGPYTGAVGAAVSFSSAGSTDPDGSIASYSWTFGDGASATGPSPAHTYAAAGTYTVTLTVTDDAGASAVDNAQVTISGGGGGNQAPTAEANGPYSGTVNTAVAFSSSGSTDSDGTIQSYSWDFGDGNSGTGASPSHTYAAAGTYTVTLTVTDDAGASATDNAQVTITGGGPTGAKGTVRGRWVDASGQELTSVSVGTEVFLEVDIEMAAGNNIDNAQGAIFFSPTLLFAEGAGHADLACSAGSACPSSPSVPAGNTDVMTFFTPAPNSDFIGFSSFSIAGPGTGIQGLGRFRFTASGSGTVTADINNSDLLLAGDGGLTVYASGGVLDGIAFDIPTLTIN